jgi:hypothetical protein
LSALSASVSSQLLRLLMLAMIPFSLLGWGV